MVLRTNTNWEWTQIHTRASKDAFQSGKALLEFTWGVKDATGRILHSYQNEAIISQKALDGMEDGSDLQDYFSNLILKLLDHKPEAENQRLRWAKVFYEITDTQSQVKIH